MPTRPLWAAACRKRISTTVHKHSQTQLRPWAVLLWLTVWQAAAMGLAAAVPHGELLLASPVQVLLRLTELMRTLSFWGVIGRSSVHILGGFLCACVLAVGLAVLSARFRIVRVVLAPPVAVIKAVPVVSFIILTLVWLDAASLPLFISALMVFPPVYLNVLTGIAQTDRQLLEMAQVFRVPFRRQLGGIWMPSVLPYFRSAVSLSLGLCWKAGSAAEVIALSAGTIGEQLYMAKVYFQTPDLFAWTVVIVVVSALAERLICALLDILCEKAVQLWK